MAIITEIKIASSGFILCETLGVVGFSKLKEYKYNPTNEGIVGRTT